jgi:diguanylate cyclase (GGDEF)-like protein
MQKVLYNISQAANSPLSLKQLYKTIHKELGTIIDTTNFYIALIDEKEDKIFFPYNIDSAKPIHLPRTIKDNSLVAQVIRSGKSTFVNREMIKEKKFMAKFKEWFGTLHKVWLGVPLKIENKTIGAMVVQSYTDPNLYSKKDIRLLEFVSNQVSTVIERKKMEKELERLAHYDVLTGCCSRGYGLNLLEQQIKTAKRKKTPILLLYLDVDNFKYINDTFGHQEGDKVLKEAAKLFKSTLREVDIICRIGGDEFLLIFPENSLNDAPLIRERLNKNLEKLNQKLAKPYKIDLSIGLSCYNPSKPQPMDELIRIADEKMYEEKRRKNKGR